MQRQIVFFNDPTKKERTYLIILLPLLFIVVVGLIKYIGVIVNITPSMKVGIYIKSNSGVKRGDIVLLCLIEPYKKIALERNYVEKGRGCSGN
jgi:hypothetical protein